MGIKVTDFLIREMQKYILSGYVKYDGKQMPKGILFYDEKEHIRENYIYIASADDYEKIYANNSGNKFKNNYLFLEDGAGNVNDLGLDTTMACFQTNLKLTALYNKIDNVLSRMGTVFHKGISEKENFSDFLYDVIAMEVVREDEIINRLKQFPNVMEGVYRILVFQFEDQNKTDIEKEAFIGGLQSIFPYSNVTYYFDKIVMMAQGKIVEGKHSMILPEEKKIELENICKQYQAWCGVSNETKNPTVIRTNYLNARTIIKIGIEMRKSKNQRVFCQEEYYSYLIFDMCYREFSRTYHNDNYLYLLHPGISEIIRYDQEHESNIREVFFCYLLNDRNLTKTANLMFIHRNTAIYKVNKAIELCGDDIENPIIRQRLLTSCMLCEYCEKVLKIKALPYPR